jgi:hypothetical protein
VAISFGFDPSMFICDGILITNLCASATAPERMDARDKSFADGLRIVQDDLL